MLFKQQSLKGRHIRITFYTLHHSYFYGFIVFLLEMMTYKTRFYKLNCLFTNWSAFLQSSRKSKIMVQCVKNNSKNLTSLFYKLDSTNWFNTNEKLDLPICSIIVLTDSCFLRETGIRTNEIRLTIKIEIGLLKIGLVFFSAASELMEIGLTEKGPKQLLARKLCN